MSCDKIKELLAGYQDGELDSEQLAMVQAHLAECTDCREELTRLDKVKEVTGKVKFNDLPLEVWEGYWHNLYRRIERGLGWITTSGMITAPGSNSVPGSGAVTLENSLSAEFSTISALSNLQVSLPWLESVRTIVSWVPWTTPPKFSPSGIGWISQALMIPLPDRVTQPERWPGEDIGSSEKMSTSP